MDFDSVAAVVLRLRDALQIPSDKLLAEYLGLAPNTLHNRIKRNSLPEELIAAACESRGLNPDWVYRGEGEIYAGDKEVRKRAKLLAEVTEALQPLRLPAGVREGINRLLAHAIGGNAQGTVREWQSIRSTMSEPEQDLLDAYRNADESLQAAFDALVRTGRMQQAGLSGAPARKPAQQTMAQFLDEKEKYPETVRMKPKEKAAYLAAKKAAKP